jgi:uncharacterized protein (DUF58 family)
LIPSLRLFEALALAGVLIVFGYVHPAFGWAGLVVDIAAVVLFVVDAVLAQRTRLTVDAELPATVYQAEETELAIALGNPQGRPVRVRVREVLGPELAATPIETELRVPGRSRRTHAATLVPAIRGRCTLAPIALRVLGPLGLAWAERRQLHGRIVRVYPRMHLGGEAGVLVQQALERRLGTNPRLARGISQELYGLREYHPGDEYRMIHWKAAARRQRPITRETVWEQHQHVLVLVDCGRPMASLAGRYSKLDHTLAAVLGLLRVTVAQQDSATLVLFGKDVRHVVRVDRRTRSFLSVFERVYDQQAGLDEPDYAAVAAWCARQVPRRSLALVCTSVIDLVGADLLARGMLALGQRHRPLLVNLQDPGLVDHARSEPTDAVGAFAKASALSLLATNDELVTRLRTQGVDVLSLPASHLAVGIIRRYLDFKERRGAGARVAAGVSR